MRAYRKLEVWKISREINKKVYELTGNFPKSEVYSLVNQMRRASVSIISNIAEGCSRDSLKEFINYLRISLGSVNELESQFYVSLDVKYINKEDFEGIMEELDKLSKKLWSYIHYLKKQEKNI